MAVMIKDIMKLKSLSQMKIAAGKDSLNKTVRWVYVAECLDDPLESITWLQGGELVCISGLGIKHNEDMLAQLVRGISEKNGAGLIVNIGPYIERIPQEAIKIADELELPLFELPWEVKLVELTKEVCSAIVLSDFEDNSLTHLLSNILFGEGILEENVIERASYFGYNLKGECQVSIINIDDFSSYLKANTITEEHIILRIKLAFIKIIQDTLERHHIKALQLAKSDAVIILNKKIEESLMQKVFQEIQEEVKRRWDGLSVSLGIGNAYTDLALMKRSLMEAEWTLKVVKIKKQKGSILSYKDIGIYALLFNIKDKETLKHYYMNTLGSAIEYDKINDTSLITTLETYITQNCNITTTAKELFLHRNTLKYRLKKIEELLKCDLHDLNDCLRLQMAMEAGKLINF